jgi:hypothetical protein
MALLYALSISFGRTGGTLKQSGGNPPARSLLAPLLPGEGNELLVGKL